MSRASLRWTVMLLSLLSIAVANGMVSWLPWWSQTPWGGRIPWWSWQFWYSFYASERWLITWICLAGGMLFATLLFLRALGYRLMRVESRQSR
jgi:hypothetical protein